MLQTWASKSSETSMLQTRASESSRGSSIFYKRSPDDTKRDRKAIILISKTGQLEDANDAALVIYFDRLRISCLLK
jgi:hypothetical protein